MDIYLDKFIVSYLNGKKEPFSATDEISYEVLENGESLGILKKKAFSEISKELRHKIYHAETGKRAAYLRKDIGLVETKIYKEWENEQIDK